ncbi:MAG TPA: methyltransferase domain-containing protein [Planctomycetota bacterium]|jgi:predicted nicotinamide N-methyase|nr:methyltransferase domain-containing protein [Planctomycetota bacterium]
MADPSRIRPGEVRALRVPLGPTVVRVRVLRDVDPWMERLTSDEVRDERFPYFGELWPAGLALARWIWRRDEVRGREVLDLGCGVGLPGIAAGMRGARVVFADIFEEALALARENAEGAGVRGAEYLRLDWRDASFDRRFDAVLGADLYYESRHHGPLLEFFARAVRPGGFVVAADPRRPNSDPFFEEAARRFAVEGSELEVELGGRRHRVRIARLTRPMPEA